MAKRKETTPLALASPRETRSATAKMAKEEARQPPVPSPLLKKMKSTKIKETEKETAADVVTAKMAKEEAQQARVPSPLLKKMKSTKIKEEETEDDSIIIEACKQCQSFKRTALKVKDGLEKNKSQVEVIINPEKPRRGCFEVRNGNGEIFVSLLDLKRPFKPMKELDLDDVVADIVRKMKSVQK